MSSAHDAGMDDTERQPARVLVLSVIPGPDDRQIARLHVTLDVTNPRETVVTTTSTEEVLARVRAFLELPTRSTRTTNSTS
jgi:hypothetical protein